MKQTPLHASHVALGAKMAPFGGYAMPIQYEGIIAEHTACRGAAVVFDTCHMGELHMCGTAALDDLEALFSAPIAAMQPGQCRYGFFCNEQGGVIDDAVVYRLGHDEFMIVVNAATQARDFAWIAGHASKSTVVENQSAATAKLDVQGPAAPRILQGLLDDPLRGMKYYRFAHNHYRREPLLVSRTGYTGEIGFELYCPVHCVESLWRALLDAGVKPAGLGARDTLRIEMGFALYGHELSESRNAAEAGFARAIATDKSFIGSTVVCDRSTVRECLVGLRCADRRSPRPGDRVVDEGGAVIGTVSSGSFSPSTGVAVALAYVNAAAAQSTAPLRIDTGRTMLSARVQAPPFYPEATARKALETFL